MERTRARVDPVVLAVWLWVLAVCLGFWLAVAILVVDLAP